jgi:SnoaL-like domain
MSAPLPGDLPVETRLARLEDERMVIDTLHRYGQGITFKDRDLWLSAFFPDAHLTMRYWPDGALAVDLRGRSELAAWYDQHQRQWPVGTEAQITINPRVEVNGDAATSICSFVVLMRSEEGAPSLRTIGRYDDDLVRNENGIWQITERRVTTTTRQVQSTVT